MNLRIVQKIFIPFVILLISHISYAELETEKEEKREKIRYAIENGIVNIYDIPFETYANLEMWDEIRFILEANNQNIASYKLPGLYYSRPFIIGDNIWVFENRGDGIFIFDPDTLELSTQKKHKDYLKYEGGIRKILNNTIISGGSDADVDMSVIWNTDTDNIRTVKLQEGHYVTSITADDGILYIGSCGGLINVWKYYESDNDIELEFLGIYTSSGEENSDWRIFNQKECITGIKVIDDKIIGVGEKSIFIWQMVHKTPIKTYQKALAGSVIFFFKDYIVEYKESKFVIRNLENGKVIKKETAEKPIDDLIVTSDKILADYDGDLLIIALHHNQGLLFYNFNTLELIEKIDNKGETLTVYENVIFATDDNHLYKYDILNKDAARYETFLKKTDPDKLILDEENYYKILAQIGHYPKMINASGISTNFLKLKELLLRHFFKYGKIGERFVPYDEAVSFDTQESNEKKRFKEDVYGYKAIYEVKNLSDKYYLVNMVAMWSGIYGKYSPYEDSEPSSYHQSFFIPPNGGRFTDQFEVGEKEPATVVIYPENIQVVSEAYYKGFIRAVSKNNKDMAVIDKYLQDNLVKDWHKKLKKRKNEIIQEEEKKSWFFKLFQ